MSRDDILVPDAEQMVYDDGWCNLHVELGEGTAFLSMTLESNRAYDGAMPRPLTISFDPQSEVPDARRIGEILIAWADNWQDEYDRFTYAVPFGINLAPNAPIKQCERHGGNWGEDETCARCTYENGEPRDSEDMGPLA